MTNYRFSALLIILLSICISAHSQYYSTGSDPASIKWSEIRTPGFQLIFPADYEANAKELAGILDQVYRTGYKSLGKEPRKISIILHTKTVNSNGLVAWAPKRMELFPTPNQQVYAQNWSEQLAIHEFRHVVQMDKIQTELPLVFKLILGEQAAAAAVAAYVPFWLLEGDAVISETALTKTGRGRNPSFLMENKAQAIQKGLFSYDKASLGSYNDFVPNRYKFGWWMAGGIRARYGKMIWSDVFAEVAQKPLSVNPINRVLKQQTGKNKEQLYSSIFDDYLNDWKSELAQLDLTNSHALMNAEDSYQNYLYTGFSSDHGLIAYKQSRDDIGRIVRIEAGQEEVIFTPGTILDESFSVEGDFLIWSERRPDLRWTHADRSVIVVYDLNRKQKRELKIENKLFAPVISASGEAFAAVEVDDQNQYFISVYNLADGKINQRHHQQQNDFMMSPAWSDDSKVIYFIGLAKDGKYLGKLDLGSGEWSQLTEPAYFDLRNLTVSNNQLYYTSAETGIDNIFRFDIETGIAYQLTSVPFGADYPEVDGNQLYFSSYSADGYRIERLLSEDFKNKKSGNKQLVSNALADTLSVQEGTTFEFTPAVKSYQAKKYSKLAHLLNFHSWAPAYINVDDYELKPGISILSQNKLGTATADLGYEYLPSERSGKVRAKFEYTGLFPVFNGEVSYGNRKSNYRLIQQNGDTVVRSFSWRELSYELGTSVPLSFSQGKYSQLIQPQIEYGYTRVSHSSTTPDQFYSGFYHALSYRLYLQNVLRQSEFDLLPKWGQIVELTYKNSPSGGTQIGDLKALQTYLYFPGFAGNQGIRIYNGLQKKHTDLDISFSDVVRFPRGIQQLSNTDLYTFGADYMFPLAYPDLNLGRLFFMKRLRTSLFYDFSSLKGNVYNEDGTVYSIYEKYLTSTGIELKADGHILRTAAPVSVGLRSMYLPDTKKFSFEFLFTISFDAI
ncbi:TolB family protein [Mangrovibacterium sp.]|uniref:TolB family protein n=1 Tax=Mangrovibacterium sp. TaxID=1961364 RepID=UPI0035689029